MKDEMTKGNQGFQYPPGKQWNFGKKDWEDIPKGQARVNGFVVPVKKTDEMTKGNFSGKAGAHVANVTRKWREEARAGAKKTETPWHEHNEVHPTVPPYTPKHKILDVGGDDVAKGCGLKPGTMRKAMDFIMNDLPTSYGARAKLLNDRAMGASTNRAKTTMADEDINEVSQKADLDKSFHAEPRGDASGKPLGRQALRKPTYGPREPKYMEGETDQRSGPIITRVNKSMDFEAIVARLLEKAKENPSWKAAEGKIVSMIEGRKK